MMSQAARLGAVARSAQGPGGDRRTRYASHPIAVSVTRSGSVVSIRPWNARTMPTARPATPPAAAPSAASVLRDASTCGGL